MKRSGAPARRTPLKRTAFVVKFSEATRLERTELRKVSKRRRRVNSQRAVIRLQVFERDGWHCKAANLHIGDCHGPLTLHEIVNRERAGRTDDNLIDPSGQLTLCAHHNTWCEDHPNSAEKLGLVAHSWDRPSSKIAPRGARSSVVTATLSPVTSIPPEARDARHAGPVRPGGEFARRSARGDAA